MKHDMIAVFDKIELSSLNAGGLKLELIFKVFCYSTNQFMLPSNSIKLGQIINLQIQKPTKKVHRICSGCE